MLVKVQIESYFHEFILIKLKNGRLCSCFGSLKRVEVASGFLS